MVFCTPVAWLCVSQNDNDKQKTMSLENAKVFYKRLATDKAFLAQIQGVKSKDECSQIVKGAGYNFTQKEFEEYTTQLLEPDATDGELRQLEQKELEAVMGGVNSILSRLPMQPPYGVVDLLGKI